MASLAVLKYGEELIVTFREKARAAAHTKPSMRTTTAAPDAKCKGQLALRAPTPSFPQW